GGGGRLLWCDGPPGGPVALVRRFEQVAGEVTTRQRSRSIFLCACFPSATDRVPVACNHRMRLHVVPSYWPTMDTEPRLFTSESVSEGHPDKVCDQVSDAILDAILAQDPDSRVACETMASRGFVVVAGEITTRAQIDYQEVVRGVVRDIGY